MYDASYHPSEQLSSPGEGLASGDPAVTSYHREPHFFREDRPTELDSEAFGDGYTGYPEDVSAASNGQMMGNITEGLASALFLGGSMLKMGQNIFYHQRQCVQMGEGPTLLRFLCFLGGFAMVVSSVLSMLNVFSLITSPSTYVLQVYQGFFGVITMIVEAKDWECLDQFKPWMIEWFRFLTVPAGKGAFYVFIGSLGISLWVRNLLAFTVGLYMASLGFICVAIHAGASHSKRAGRLGCPFSSDLSSPVIRSNVLDCAATEDEELNEEDYNDMEDHISLDRVHYLHNPQHHGVVEPNASPSHTGHLDFGHLQSGSNSTASSPTRTRQVRPEFERYMKHDLRRETTTTTSATGSGGLRFPHGDQIVREPRMKKKAGPNSAYLNAPRYTSSTASSVGNPLR